MDVSCERCKAEYEFDDSLLGDHGTTVKCSSCGHVFRVAAPARHPSEPSRPSLKLRFARDGRVDSLSSLRDLQRRVHEGTAGLDDELGRDGFPWRKLSEVPELRSFFVRPAAPVSPRSGQTLGAQPPHRPLQGADTPLRRPSALAVSQSSMPAPPRDPSNANRTVLGIGPAAAQPTVPQIPRPPRMPNVAGPGGSLPRPASATASQATPIREMPNQAANAASTSDAPTDPPPAMSGASPARPRSVAPPPVPSNPVQKLYLADDEAPPQRATEGSSRIWIIAGVAGAIALGGVLVAASLRSSKAAPAAEIVGAPRVEAPPVPAAVAPTDPAVAPAPAEAAKPSAPAPTAAAQAPTPSAQPAANVEPVEAADSADAPSAQAEPSSAGSKGKAAADAPEETPRDYGGFVAQGDAALVRGDNALAQKAYAAALAMRASGSEATTGLGYALLAEGKAQDALPYFERAARNGYAEASIGLGDAHKKLGQSDDAREAYNSYLERLPNGARAAYAKKQLASLGGGGGSGGGGSKPEAKEPAAADPGEYRPAGELNEAPAAEEIPAPSSDTTP